MRNTITLNNSRMPLVEYQGLRVVTFAMVDDAHQRPKGTAKATFSRHRSRFVEGRHYHELNRDEIHVGLKVNLTGDVKRTQTNSRPTDDAKRRQSIESIFPAHTRKGIVITEMGYLLLVKPFQDDLSWLIQEELVNAYFRHIPQFPELRKVHVPDIRELAALPLQEAQHLIARVERESFTQHGQKGSAAMRLRREELKKIRPAHRLIGELSQPQLPEVEGEADE